MGMNLTRAATFIVSVLVIIKNKGPSVRPCVQMAKKGEVVWFWLWMRRIGWWRRGCTEMGLMETKGDIKRDALHSQFLSLSFLFPLHQKFCPAGSPDSRPPVMQLVLFLCSLAVDRDKVVPDDEDHGQAADAVGKECQLVIVDHLLTNKNDDKRVGLLDDRVPA